ncbi:nuclear envelope integral membrane protein [Lycorma delicatula]|uniref:nuclear envelope integral membrane protein n=1 Tax=Lycorma delicatula TaxID=130591 RepID=UPI003F510A83
MLFKIQSLICISFLFFKFRNVSCKWNVHHLDAGDPYSCCSLPLTSADRSQPQIYCYAGRGKHLIHIFETVLLEISIPPEQYQLYEGSTIQEVMTEFESHRSLWNLNFFTWKRKDVRLNPFNSTCIGIVTEDDYRVELNVIRIDYWRVILFTSGALLFFLGPKLSKNVLFYYICGVSLGVFASLLIAIYFVCRLLPRKPLMYGIVAGGWAISLYLFQIIWENLRTLLQLYRKYVLIYIAISAGISFLFCYWFGPVTHPRSRNIIKWILQAVGLAGVLFCSHFQEATLAIDMILIVAYNFPSSWFSGFKRVYKTYIVKPKPRLLTEDEYYEQGVKETAKALEELRAFCSSPNCNQWQTVTQLKDPIRFANFIQGGSHLDDTEILAFETETNKQLILHDDNFTDDSDG